MGALLLSDTVVTVGTLELHCIVAVDGEGIGGGCAVGADDDCEGGEGEEVDEFSERHVEFKGS